MNPNLFSDKYNNLLGAFEINQHARRQEKHQAYLKAEWKYCHQQPAVRKPDWVKILFSRLQVSLTAPIRLLTPARRQQNQF